MLNAGDNNRKSLFSLTSIFALVALASKDASQSSSTSYAVNRTATLFSLLSVEYVHHVSSSFGNATAFMLALHRYDNLISLPTF